MSQEIQGYVFVFFVLNCQHELLKTFCNVKNSYCTDYIDCSALEMCFQIILTKKKN